MSYNDAMAKVLASKRVRRTKRHTGESLTERYDIECRLRMWEGKYLVFGATKNLGPVLSDEAFNALLSLVYEIKGKKN